MCMSGIQRWSLLSLLSPELTVSLAGAFVFGINGNEALLITDDDSVYSVGGSGCFADPGQNGLEPVRVENLSGKRLVDVACGSGPHVLALTSAGDLFTWGYNGFCQLGNGNTNQLLSPALCSLLEKRVGAVACGSHHSLALTQDGEVYAWGCNNYGQVGSGATANQATPRRLSGPLSKRRVRLIGCCQASSFAVEECGDAYAWGCNASGQLGIGGSANQNLPVKIEGLNGLRIASIACGFDHAMALTDQGHLYVWGANVYGQLGTGCRVNSQTPRRALKSFGRLLDVGAVHYSATSAALVQTGAVLAWGNCRGQAVMHPIQTHFTDINEVFACLSHPQVTCRRLTFSKITSPSVADAVRSAFNDQSSSDVAFQIDGGTVFAHRSILRIRCRHLATMLNDNWSEGRQSVISVREFSYAVYRAFLEYLYTDEVNVAAGEAIGLLDLANCYCEMPLKRKCELLIRRSVTMENVLQVYCAAMQYSAQDLENFCFDFAVHHLSEVVDTESFIMMDSDLMKQFVRKAASVGAFKY